MKKIIIAAGIILTAAVTQAAAVGWSLAGATNYKGGSYSVFVVGLNGVTGSDQIKAIVAAGGLSSADSYAFYSGGTVASNGSTNLGNADSGKSITWSGSGTDTYAAFIFVQDAEGKNASFSANKEISLTNDSTSKTWAFQSQATNFSSNSFTVNTPEPTSGVLLLLGMAGLALKRKRA